MNQLKRSNLKHTRIALSVACFFYAGFANAQTQIQDKIQASAKAPDSVPAAVADCHRSETSRYPCELAPIVVTASAPDIGQAYLIKANPKQPIQPVPASDGADYLKHIAGFNAIRNGGTNGDPTFRGLFGSRLKILTNGSEMLGACPARMDAPTSYISPQNFDDITVVKGPQTVLWGAASAATVNFSRQPERFDTSGVKAQGSIMAASNQRFDTDVDSAIGNEMGSIRLNANTSQAGDYKDGNGNTVPAKWDKWNADVSATYTPDDDSWLELSAGRGDGEARYAGRGMDGSQFLRNSAGLRFEKNNVTTLVSKLEGQLNYNHANHIMDNFSLRRPVAGMDHGHGSMPDHDAGDMNPDTVDHGSMDHDSMAHDMDHMAMGMAMQLERKTLSGRLAATLDWQDYTLIAGLDANRNQHQGRMGGQDNYKQMPYNRDASFNQAGVFAELGKPLNERDTLIGGLRLDRHNVKDERPSTSNGHGETIVNPGYGKDRQQTLPSGFVRLESQWGSQINSYAGLGHVQRMPDYWELFSPVHYADTTAFLGVKPEKTTQLDLGINHHSGAWSNWASVYAGKIDDFILMSYHLHGSSISAGAKNIDASIAGIEAGTTYQLNDQFSADLNLAYAWGRNDSDKSPLPQIAPLETRLGLTYQQDQFSLGTVLRLVAAQDRIAANQGNIVGYDLGKSPGFGVFSVNAAYQVSPRVNMSAGIDNLFDRAYHEHLNKAGNSAFGYAATEQVNEIGRNVWAKLSFKY